MINNYNETDVQAIRAFFLSKKFNEYAIAGILANLYSESRLRSNNLQDSYSKSLGLSDEEYTLVVDNGSYTNFATDSAGYGLCQWTSSGRKERLFNFIKARGVSISNRNAQLEFLWWELNNGYTNVLKALQEAKSVDEASRVVMLKFERPANQTEAYQLVRVGYGLEFYEKYAVKEEVKEEGKPMYKIAIDAGHGVYTAGKRITLDGYADTREWILNNRIAYMLEELLKGYNCAVLRVDDVTGRTDVTNTNRAVKANEWGADIYISIHHNAGLYGRKGGGTVVYYASSKPERAVQAKALYNAVIAETGLVGNRSSKTIKKGFTVIAKADAPSFLIENGFMDSPDDVPIIITEAHAKKTAKGLLNFLVDYFGLVKTGETPKEETKVETPKEESKADETFLVRIAVKSLNYRSGPGTNYKVNGQVSLNQVYTIVKTSGNWGKLKSGAGWICIEEKYVKRL